jgi:hypothetical protein
MGFSGPQLAAVPSLFGWESLNGWDFLGHNLLLSQASFGGNPLMDEIFWATTCCCLSPLFGGNPLMDGIFWATTCCCLRPLFPRWNSGYHEAFFTNFFFGILAMTKPCHKLFSFFTMEFWLSRSLSHELFSFFTMEFWLSRSLSHELFFGILAMTKPLSRTFFFFHDGILEIRNLGEDSFHIYITKSIYIGSASLKTLPLDLEPPLQRKEYGPSYSNATRKSKTNFLYRHQLWTRDSDFLVL